jgi:outer membrane biosynthesis protein TonB
VRASGTVVFSLVVDAQGRPRNIIFEQPLGNELDYLAVRVMGNDRFQPATFNDVPIATAGTAELRLEACETSITDSNGHTSLTLHLRAMPKAKFKTAERAARDANLAPTDPQSSTAPSIGNEDGVTPPVALNNIHPGFPGYAADSRIHGNCRVSLIVDEHGLPGKAEASCAEHPSSQQAASAIARQYRFKPALKDEMPVRAQIYIEVVGPPAP